MSNNSRQNSNGPDNAPLLVGTAITNHKLKENKPPQSRTLLFGQCRTQQSRFWVIARTTALLVAILLGGALPALAKVAPPATQPAIAHVGPAWLYPDPKITPGLIDHSLTQEVICSPTFSTKQVRHLTESEKVQVAAAYGISFMMSKGKILLENPDVEFDHFLALELGGANDNDVDSDIPIDQNIWVEPYDPGQVHTKKTGSRTSFIARSAKPTNSHWRKHSN